MSDEFNYSFGEQGKGSEHNGLEAYGLDLNHTINDNLSTDIFYTNQGHFPEHHRDGAGASLMLNKQLLPQLTVSVGAGPWAYADTLIPDNGKHRSRFARGRSHRRSCSRMAREESYSLSSASQLLHRQR